MRINLNEKLALELEQLKNNGTYKYPKYNLSSFKDGSIDVLDYGNEIILCSNNYLGLSSKEEIVSKASDALLKYGAGASSVRFICGTFDIHKQLEDITAKFLNMESSISYTSCFAANNACIPALLSNEDAVISDELNHASIIDACRLTSKGVKKLVYKHSDMADLEEKLKQVSDCSTVLIVTDGVFSMEGDIAKLPEIIELSKKYNAVLMIDDSHATGVIGATGRGTMEYYNITNGVDIISGTYGKALGGAGGGFIAATKNICDMLFQKSRPHLFSNSLPPVLCAIAIESINYLDKNPNIVKSLKEKTEYCRTKLKDLNPLEGDSAIIPIVVGDTAKAIKISKTMMDKGVFTIGFGFPVVPEGTARIRLQISDALTYENLDYAIKVIKETFEQL